MCRHWCAALPAEDSRAKQTSVVWQTCNPVWDESLVFRDVCTASELVVSCTGSVALATQGGEQGAGSQQCAALELVSAAASGLNLNFEWQSPGTAEPTTPDCLPGLPQQLCKHGMLACMVHRKHASLSRARASARCAGGPF